MKFHMAFAAASMLMASAAQAGTFLLDPPLAISTPHHSDRAISALNNTPVYLLVEGLVTKTSYPETINGDIISFVHTDPTTFRLWVYLDTAHFGADTDTSPEDAHYETYSDAIWTTTPYGAPTIIEDFAPTAKIQLGSDAPRATPQMSPINAESHFLVNLHDAPAGTNADSASITLALKATDTISLSLTNKKGNLLTADSYLFDWRADEGDSGSALYTRAQIPVNAPFTKYSIDLTRVAISTSPIQPISEVPAPGAAILFGSALVGLGLQAKRRKG